ncbi:MAG: hypothetical protein OCD00_10435 [Colwellia sp.]
MSNQIFDNFDRTEFSDEIFAILGRALTVATRFDTSTKALARLPLFQSVIVKGYTLNADEYNELVQSIHKKYKNLNRAIESLKLNKGIEELLTQARESRNELIHGTTLGSIEGFDNVEHKNLLLFLEHIKDLVLDVIKGETIISMMISKLNNEPISNFQFSEKYEKQYLNWVMERFE